MPNPPPFLCYYVQMRTDVAGMGCGPGQVFRVRVGMGIDVAGTVAEGDKLLSVAFQVKSSYLCF